jgi:hypothetical protein
MAHHDHSHPDGEVCEHTPIDIDADLEHDHRLHNHLHHNLHQHVSNEISTASSVSAVNQNFHNNKNSTCVPCAYSNDIRPSVPLMEHDIKEDLVDMDNYSPVSVVVKKETTSTNLVFEQLRKKRISRDLIDDCQFFQ